LIVASRCRHGDGNGDGGESKGTRRKASAGLKGRILKDTRGEGEDLQGLLHGNGGTSGEGGEKGRQKMGQSERSGYRLMSNMKSSPPTCGHKRGNTKKIYTGVDLIVEKGPA